MITTIQITKETLERLKSIKLAKRESYDEIVNRLIDKHAEKIREEHPWLKRL